MELSRSFSGSDRSIDGDGNVRTSFSHWKDLVDLDLEGGNEDVVFLKSLLNAAPMSPDSNKDVLCEEHQREITKVVANTNDNRHVSTSANAKLVEVKRDCNDYARIVVFGACDRKRSVVAEVDVGSTERVSVFDVIVLFLIIANTLVVVLSLHERGRSYNISDKTTPSLQLYASLQIVFLVLFTIEASLKMAAYGSSENKCCRLGIQNYMKKRWNVFDLFLVCLGWVGLLLRAFSTATPNSFGVRIFRIFRAVRSLRMFHGLKIVDSVVVRGTKPVYLSLVAFVAFAYCMSLVGHALFKNSFRTVCFDDRNSTIYGEKRCSDPDTFVARLGAFTCNASQFCGFLPPENSLNIDNYDTPFESFLTSNYVMAQSGWFKEYEILEDSKSWLASLPFHLVGISFKMMIDLLITAIFCVLFSNVRDSYFNKSEKVRRHRERIAGRHSTRPENISFGGLYPQNCVSNKLREVVEHYWFWTIIVLIIVANMVTLLVYASAPTDGDIMLQIFFACVYLVELAMKVCAYGCGFVQADPYNLLDAAIALAGIPLLFPSAIQQLAGFQLFRLFRIVRVLRIGLRIGPVKEILDVVLDSNWTAFLIVLFNLMTIAVLAILFTSLNLDMYASLDVTCESQSTHGHPGLFSFQKIQYSALTLFVNMGGSGTWDGMRTNCAKSKFIYLGMIIWIAIISNVLLKLIVGVVVSNFEASDSQRRIFNEKRFQFVRQIKLLEQDLSDCAPKIKRYPYAQLLQEVINRLGDIKTKILSSSGKLPAVETFELQRCLNKLIISNVCPSLLRVNEGRSTKLENLTQKIIRQVPLTIATSTVEIRTNVACASLLLHLLKCDINMRQDQLPAFRECSSAGGIYWIEKTTPFTKLEEDFAWIERRRVGTNVAAMPILRGVRSNMDCPRRLGKVPAGWINDCIPILARLIAVIMVVFMFCFIWVFAGYMFFRGQIGACLSAKNGTTLAINKIECAKRGTWRNNFGFSFDTLWDSFMTILDLLAENNKDKIFDGMAKAPVKGGFGRSPSAGYLLFPMTFLVLVPRGLLFLFSGVIVQQFSSAEGTLLLTNKQRAWADKKTLGSAWDIAPTKNISGPPAMSNCRYPVYRFFCDERTGKYRSFFTGTVYGTIIVYGVLGAMFYDGDGNASSNKTYIQVVVFSIYCVETVLRLVAVGVDNNIRSWDFKFLLLVVITTSVLMIIAGVSNDASFVCMRLRLLQLIKPVMWYSSMFRKLCKTLELASMGLLRVVLAYLIVTFCFCAIGLGMNINAQPTSMFMSLFSVFSGGDFHVYSRLSPSHTFFFFSYFFLTKICIWNLALAVMISKFRLVYSSSSPPLHRHEIAAFRQTWFHLYGNKGSIPVSQCEKFLLTLAKRIEEDEESFQKSSKKLILLKLKGSKQRHFGRSNLLAKPDDEWRRKKREDLESEYADISSGTTTVTFAAMLRCLIQERLSKQAVELRERLRQEVEKDKTGKHVGVECAICALMKDEVLNLTPQSGIL